MPTDIRLRQDLELIMETFYQKLLADDEMRPIFTEVAKINLQEHLPFLADFWESILFQKGIYRKNVMEIHLRLHDEYPLEKRHFDRWLGYFNETVDGLFAGEKAQLMKDRAKSIALLMQVKIDQADSLTG